MKHDNVVIKIVLKSHNDVKIFDVVINEFFEPKISFFTQPKLSLSLIK